MKRFLILLLILSLTIPCFLFSCQNSGIGSEGTSSSTTNSDQTPPSNVDNDPDDTEESYNSVTNIPENLNYGGEKEVNIICSGRTIYGDEISVEMTNGDPINDAIYQRNLNVETTLGVKIISHPIAVNNDWTANFDCINKVKTEMNGGAYNYDIMYSPSYACVFRTSDGLWEDLLSVPHLDLSREYWSNLYSEQVEIGNRQYFATGPIVLSLQRMIFATVFNKTLTEQHNIENLYEVVKEGRWTIEYQSKIVANAYSEMDSIEGYTDGDFYGFVTNTNVSTDPYWTIWDISVLSRTDDGYFTYDFKIEEATNFVNTVMKFYWENPGVHLYLPEGDNVDQDKIRSHFADGRAIMAQIMLQQLEHEEMRTMSDPYGIIPLPKFEENDLPYYSAAYDSFTCVSILRGQSSIDLEMCGAVLELMACESYNVVQPAYYEIALKGKYSKDEESWEMLDNMMKNFRVDQDFLYSTTDTTDILQDFRNAIATQNKSFSTLMKNKDDRTKRMVEFIIKKVRDMHGD